MLIICKRLAMLKSAPGVPRLMTRVEISAATTAVWFLTVAGANRVTPIKASREAERNTIVKREEHLHAARQIRAACECLPQHIEQAEQKALLTTRSES